MIDDQAGFRRCLTWQLEHAGHQVMEAASGADGVRQLQAAQLDLVVTDLGMPDGSGWQVVRAAHRLRPNLPVIVMTGCPEALEEGAGAAVPVAGHLFKPFPIKDLLNRIAALQAKGQAGEREA